MDENNIKDPGLRAFVMSVTENTSMWQAYRNHVIVEDDDQEKDLLLAMLRGWWVVGALGCVYFSSVDHTLLFNFMVM